MYEPKVVRRYLKALAELVDEHDFNAVDEQLKSLVALIAENEQLYLALSTPILSIDQKIELLKIIRQSIELHQLLDRFLKVLIEADRFAIINEVAEQFADFWFSVHGIKIATIYSVIPLSPEQQKKLKIILEDNFQQKFFIKNIINKDLLAGIVVQIGSTSYDFSLQCKILKLREKVIGES